ESRGLRQRIGGGGAADPAGGGGVDVPGRCRLGIPHARSQPHACDVVVAGPVRGDAGGEVDLLDVVHGGHNRLGEQIAGDELDVIAGSAHGHGVLFTIQLHLSGSSPARESGPAEVSPVASNLWTLTRTALRICIAHILRPWSSPSSGPATSGVLTARSFFWPRACHSHCPTLLPAVVRRGGSQ